MNDDARSQDPVHPIMLAADAGGAFPNNPDLPLLVYAGAFLPVGDLNGDAAAAAIEARFNGNGWPAAWRNGVYEFQHYHATAHEVLGIYRGRARVQFGGPNGPVLEVSAGDAVLLPAGTAHKRIDASADFAVVGAYPPGQHPDMCYGKAGERPRTDAQISQVPMPQSDPVLGDAAGVMEYWR